MTNRTRLLVFWDFQNEGVGANRVQNVNDRISSAMRSRFGGASSQMFKAFGGTNQSPALDRLRQVSWRIRSINGNVDERLIAEAKSDCGQDPTGTLFVLISRDTDYAEMMSDLREQGVDVYVGHLTPETPSPALRNAVGRNHVINLQ